MKEVKLSQNELSSIKVGELTLATVMLVFTAVIMAVVAYKYFVSKEGKAALPGGYKFEWK
ncbi:MAG: hypothetical protein SPL02_01020 [Bacilli bacterium]|nr:hypothetical protein [Bacilli bacterium]MDY6431212.1 hypothetical protein [Bacilli bacterium]